jgi:hypothetical protein
MVIRPAARTIRGRAGRGGLQAGELAAGDGLHPGGAQAFGDVVGQLGGAGCQASGNLAAKLVRERGGGVVLVVHACIPFAFSALLRAWTAREQWVLTLPSEQPMAAAVSATSISSQ